VFDQQDFHGSVFGFQLKPKLLNRVKIDGPCRLFSEPQAPRVGSYPVSTFASGELRR
jgi:hypothetical protein